MKKGLGTGRKAAQVTLYTADNTLSDARGITKQPVDTHGGAC